TRNNIHLPRHFLCLPEMINDSDYLSAYMGKWHLGDEVFAQHGFQEWVSILDGRDRNLTEKSRRKIVSDYDKFLLSEDLEPDKENTGIFSRGFASTLPIELSKPKFLETKVCDFLEQHRRD